MSPRYVCTLKLTESKFTHEQSKKPSVIGIKTTCFPIEVGIKVIKKTKCKTGVTVKFGDKEKHFHTL